MSGEMEVRVSANWTRWERGFGDLGAEFEQAAEGLFAAAVEHMFDVSQRDVHVISGFLRSSGSVRHWRERGVLHAAIEYDAPYAVYEHARGGPHAFMDRAYDATQEQFGEAFPKAWEAVLASWR